MPPAWIFSFTEASSGASAVARASNAPFTFATPNQLQVDAPTLMTEWLITALNVLVGGVFTPTAGEPALTATYILKVLIGGDVVFTALGEKPAVYAVGVGSSSFAFRADLVNPLVLPRGRSLALQVEQVVPTATTSQSITVAIPPSSMNYTLRKLTGHRELS